MPPDHPGPVSGDESGHVRGRVGRMLGPAAFALLLLLPPPEGMTPAAWSVTAAAAWMAVWWASEAVPVAVTALLPLVLFPLLGVGAIGETAAPYANPLIFLFLGGFLIALGLQRWNLHRRIALHIVFRVGARPSRVVAGFMAATAALSMWVSNTATTMMMLPIALSVIGVVAPGARESGDRNARNFAIACLLGVAYAASIGGLGTLVGTPPNALLAAFMGQTYGFDVGFATWMALGLPVVAVMLPLAWLVLTRLAYPFRLDTAVSGRGVVSEALLELGPLTVPEKRVAAIFALVALLWVTRPLIDDLPGLGALSDPAIAILGAVLLYVVPSGRVRGEFLLDWTAAERLPWSVLILFGGGLSLAGAVSRTGLAEWIGEAMAGFAAWPLLALVVAVTLVIILLTELTSNTATTAAFLPVLASMAEATGAHPLLLAAPGALAATCAFMLPVATPPNAIVYGSGLVTVPQMVRAGILLNLVGAIVIALLASALLPVVFDLGAITR